MDKRQLGLREQVRIAEQATSKFLVDFGKYVLFIRSDVHVKRARVAVLWSAISLFYIVFDLEVSSSNASSLWGVVIHNTMPYTFLVFLFFLTAYYVVRFGFSIAKIRVDVDPCALLRVTRAYKKNAKLNFTLEIFKGNINHMHAYLHSWVIQKTVILGKEHRPDIAETSYERMKGFANLEQADEVRHNLRHPMLGYLENFFAPMTLPILLCSAALLAFLWEFASLAMNGCC